MTRHGTTIPLIAVPFVVAALGLLFVTGAQPRPSLAQSLAPGDTLPMRHATFPDATSGTQVRLSDVTGQTGTVFVFYCNRCLWVDAYEDRLLALAERYAPEDIRFVLVNANDPRSFPLDAYDASRERARTHGYDVPYLMDKTAAFANALGAERTPQVYVFDGADRLVYTGAVDDSPSDARKVEHAYLRDALEALRRGTAVAVPQTKPFGCSLRCPLDADGSR